ncbi:MAG: MerR family transcriptional regulator [Thermodesulfobacteriota bacterium]
MKISELSQRTKVSKETIHHYIHVGLLRKPKKTKENVVNYSEAYVERIRIIKRLREDYFLPLPVIKELIRRQKRQSCSEKIAFQFLSEYFRPVDRLLSDAVIGKEDYRKVTGLGKKWLEKMEAWGIITADDRTGTAVYSYDDVMVGKLLVDLDRIGLGPKNGFDPQVLKPAAEMFRKIAKDDFRRFMALIGNGDISRRTLKEKGDQARELMCLFFYHIYRKFVLEEYRAYLKTAE